MALQIEIAPRRHFTHTDLWAMHRLRARVFRERMGWDVPLMSGMEIDGYDAIDPYYMLMRADDQVICGCWRLLPTEGPYMLKDTFPTLLHGRPAPCNARVWELSRFAIDTGDARNFGFSGPALQSIGEIIAYGHRAGITHYVTVTTTAIERMLRRAGVVIERFGPPQQIGVERAVALTVDIGASHPVRQSGWAS